MRHDRYADEVLQTWEEAHKKGHLSLWILVALRDKPRYPKEVSEFVRDVAPTMTCEGQSLYRALRRFHDLELVTYSTRKGARGPDRKYYRLTSLGERVLASFIERNVSFLYSNRVRSLLLEAS